MDYREFSEKAIAKLTAEKPTYKNCEMLSWMYAVRDGCRAPLDRETAMAWTNGMENADGTTGPHWSMEETNALLSHRGTGEDPLHFWVAMNAVYSDLGPVLTKYGLDAPGTCADFACAFWLHDKDAVEDKLAAYYGCVVRHTIR